MTWFKVDDSFPTHPKVRSIPRRSRMAALGVWLACGAWSSHHLTDGVVTRDVVEDEGGRQIDAKALVEAGLWHIDGHECPDCPQPGKGSYQFHDWHDWQPSREEVLAKRAEDARRKAEWRARREAEKAKQRGDQAVNVPAGQTPDGQWDSAPTDAVSPAAPTRPDPTRPDPDVPTERLSGLPRSESESSVTPGANSSAGRIVAEWSEAMKTLTGAAPIGKQATTAGHQVREMLGQGNSFELVREAALLAAAKASPWISNSIGAAVEARRKAHTFHDDKGNPAYSPPPVNDPFADLVKSDS